ncbi:hypothetical protein M0805_002562 [Coniferiporia weirii]|nr:hypothetical protein M0805_002562 [Coniferiporia weirii]
MSRPTSFQSSTHTISGPREAGFTDIDADEKQFLRYLTLLDTRNAPLDKVKVEPLRKKDAKQAAKTMAEATEHDPCRVYIYDTPDARETPFTRWIEHLQYGFAARQWVRLNVGLTVDHGRAVVCALPAPAADHRSRRNKRLDKINRFIIRSLDYLGKSKEQRRRLNEIQAKFEKCTEELLGADAREMRCVNALATAPASQRHGYGGALVSAITQLADAEGRSTYLFSSNLANTEFYNSLGFFTLAEVVVGDDNPSWTRPPVRIPLMIRIYGDQ